MTTTTLRATITPADQAADPYFYLPFEVLEGTSRIDVTLVYPNADDCIVDLGCLDPRIGPWPSPEGFRGWSGGARDRFFVATDDATPGYVHGPIPPGRWQVILGLYRIPPAGAPVVVTVTTDAAARPTTPQPGRRSPVRSGAGWYRGDLHCHTHHSDARGGPELLHAAARQAGLDFLAVTDHNTTTQRRYFHPASSPDLVFVRGMEVTTATGHANVYGVDDWVDFRMTRPADAHALAALVHARGGLISVNHDKPTIPWDYELPAIDCMEVWQSAWPAWNWISLARWQDRLAAGARIALIGGSDFHQPDRLLPEGPLALARPTTVLELPELSEAAILAAMKAGRGYVTEAPDGPHLAITADGAPMGGSIRPGPVTAAAEIRGADGDTLVWLDASGPIRIERIPADRWTAGIAATPAGFLRAEVVAEASRPRLTAAYLQAMEGKPLPAGLAADTIAAHPFRRALTNPIYVEAS